MRFKLDFTDFVFTDADTMGGVTWKREINSGDDFSYGTAAMTEVKFAILAEAVPGGVSLENRSFVLYISQVESGEAVWEDYGTFYVKTNVKSGHKLDITAYDDMSKFEVAVDEWLSSLTFPMAVSSLLNMLLAKFGVTLGSSAAVNGSYVIENNFGTPGITGRNVLAYIAEATGTFAFIQRGAMVLSAVTDSGAFLDRSIYRTAKIAEYTVPAADKVQIRVSENDIGVVSGSGDNPWVIEDNPLLYTSSETLLSPVAANLLTRISAVTYVPVTVELFSDNGIDTGQYYTVNGVRSLVMSKTMKPSGVTLTCSGALKRSQTVSGQSRQITMLRGRTNVLERSLEQTLSRITDAEGNITTLTQTAESLSSRIEDAEGNISYLEQTVNGFEARITNAEGDAAEALASAESLEYRMTTAEGNISTALQTAEKIEWIIASGTSSTNFTLTSRMAELISDNISLRGKTIALTTDSINITSTYFNVATTGAVDCTSLSVTGDKSSINITGNSSDSGIIKAIFSSNPSFNTVHTPAAFSAYFPYGYSFYGGQYADQLDGSTGYTHVSRFSASEFYVGSASKINPAIKATVYDSGTDYVLIGGQLSVYGYKNRVEQTAHFGDRLMYTFETPSPLYSDIGRGTVGDDGLCYIDLDPIFYECIDNAYEYFVFLQRESGGDLIVSARYADYFVVSGTPGSRFAWMLIAPQRGASATREEELHVPESEPVSEINQENVAADEMTTAVLNEFESQLY